MSGVLNRMVARARGDLPSVEPLAKPRFQPSAVEMPQESLLEKERTRPNPPHRIELQTRDIAAQVRQPVTSKPPEPTKQNRSIETEPVEQSFKKAITPAADSAVRSVHESAPALERQFSPSSKVKESAEPEEISVNARRDSEQKTDALLQPEKSRSNDEAISIVTTEPQSSTERDTSTGFLEGPPEIRISIGAIELQVAPREVRPRPASFRPRVSLDDFLSRSRG